MPAMNCKKTKYFATSDLPLMKISNQSFTNWNSYL